MLRAVTAELSLICLVPVWSAAWRRRVLHLVYLEVVSPAGRVGRLVYDEAVKAHGVLDLDGVGLGLGGVVRLHVRPFGPLYGLLGSVGQGHQPRKELVQILYGGGLLGLLVYVPRDGEACPYGGIILPVLVVIGP